MTVFYLGIKGIYPKSVDGSILYKIKTKIYPMDVMIPYETFASG